jgi:hypothetical protein
MDIYKCPKHKSHGVLKTGFLMVGTDSLKCSITNFQKIYKTVSINVGNNV